MGLSRRIPVTEVVTKNLYCKPSTAGQGLKRPRQPALTGEASTYVVDVMEVGTYLKQPADILMGDHRHSARGKDFGLNWDINPREKLPRQFVPLQTPVPL